MGRICVDTFDIDKAVSIENAGTHEPFLKHNYIIDHKGVTGKHSNRTDLYSGNGINNNSIVTKKAHRITINYSNNNSITSSHNSNNILNNSISGNRRGSFARSSISCIYSPNDHETDMFNSSISSISSSVYSRSFSRNCSVSSSNNTSIINTTNDKIDTPNFILEAESEEEDEKEEDGEREGEVDNERGHVSTFNISHIYDNYEDEHSIEEGECDETDESTDSSIEYIINTTPDYENSDDEEDDMDLDCSSTQEEDNYPKIGKSPVSIYRCETCYSDICISTLIISKDFWGNFGEAYFVRGVLNVREDSKEVIKNMRTGKYGVKSLYCIQCNKVLGWKYVTSLEPTERYKVDKCVIEKNVLKTYNVSQ